MLPGEFVALMVFVFAPPLLLALAGQLLFLHDRTCVTAFSRNPASEHLLRACAIVESCNECRSRRARTVNPFENAEERA